MPRLAVLFVLSSASLPCPDLNLIHYISTPTKTATNRWRKSLTTPKTANNTSPISTTTKSALRESRRTSSATCCGRGSMMPGAACKQKTRFTRMRISRSDCRTNTLMQRRGCITICSGIMRLNAVGLLTKIRLGCWAGRIFIFLQITHLIGSIL